MKKLYLVGNAHIDPVWLWRKPEGLSEIMATFRSALDRMNEFPDYVFTSACAFYYKWAEQIDPGMFSEIKTRVAEGRWSVVGGFWVQPDCNIPSGEAFVRHLLYSQKYFFDKFGIKATVGYNVDSFGHNGSLPQILSKAGMDAYVFMRPDSVENPRVPGDVFVWEGPDGSRITALRISHGYGVWEEAFEHGESVYESRACAEKAAKVFEEVEKDGLPRMCFYGIGNHGGGPSVRSLNTYIKMRGERGDMDFASIPRYLEEMKNEGLLENLPVYKSDLQHHASGCYSANAAIKAANRRAENALAAAEKYDLLSSLLTRAESGSDKIRPAWEKVLFNQFHDILAGCSIKEACTDALAEFAAAADAAAELTNLALGRIAWNIRTTDVLKPSPAQKNGWVLWEKEGEGAPAVVFNPHSFPITVPIQLNVTVKGVADFEGKPVPVQTVRGPQTNGGDLYNTLFAAELPAFGYSTYYLYKDAAFEIQRGNLSATASSLENEFVKIIFDARTGAIAGYFNKETGTELTGGQFARAVVIDDADADTWSHGIFTFDKEIGEFSRAEISATETGPIRACVRVKTYYGGSELIQDFYLHAGSGELTVKCKLNFQERLKIVKLSFPAQIKNAKAVYSAPYGFIEKEADGQEEPSHEWAAVVGEENGRGLALLNDCKYSFCAAGNDLRMVAARGAAYADHYGQGSRDDFIEYQDQGENYFTYMLAPFERENFSGIAKNAALLNQPPTALLETHHDGALPPSFSGIEVSEENVIVQVMKFSEDKNGTVLRAVETEGRETTATIKSAPLNCEFNISFSAQEFKTFLISDGGEAREVNLYEE